jgi:hypothetical protein
MKINLAIIFTILSINYGICQKVENLDYCNCLDKIENNEPNLEGNFERICNNQVVETGGFKNGEKNGQWITYSKKGALIRKVNYTDGKLNGSVELYYLSSQPKLIANFINGKKDGKWTYFTKKGNVFIEGEFSLDKPINVWTIKDDKGKKILIQYDYTNLKYLVNNPANFHSDNAILKNENSEEYYILKYPKRVQKEGTQPIGGFYFASDIFVELVEIPLDYWDTYMNYKYKATFKVGTDNSSLLSIAKINDHMPDSTPIYPFIISTNPDSKIKKIEHSQLSIKLLDNKIFEALSFMPPWIYGDSNEVEVYVPYVINKILKY